MAKKRINLISDDIKLIADKILKNEKTKTFYLLDLDSISKKVSLIKQSWNKYFSNVIIAYSYKTNSLKYITQTMKKLGLSAEVTSNEELQFALDDGYNGKDIYFNGPLKSIDSLKKAINIKASVHIDSLQELKDVDRTTSDLKRNCRVLIRLACDYKNSLSRFGLCLDNLQKAYEMIANSKYISFLGFHMHVGSNINDPEIYLKSLKFYSEHIKSYYLKHESIVLDIGGGFPANSINHKLPPVNQDIFAKVIAKYLSNLGLDLKNITLIIEPGRSLVEDKGYLVSSVRVIKKRKTNILIVDGGINLVRSISGWRHEVDFIRKFSKDSSNFYAVYGSNCFESDIFHNNLQGPKDISTDDGIIVSCAGGYDIPSANVWTRVSPCVYAFMSGDYFLIKNTQTIKQMRTNQKSLSENELNVQLNSFQSILKNDYIIQDNTSIVLAPYVKIIWSKHKKNRINRFWQFTT